MTISESSEPKAYQRAGWVVLFALAILLALNSLFFGLLGVTPDIFETDTGVAWSEFSAAYPTVAMLLDLAERLNGTGYFGTALFAAFVAFFGLRRGARWAWVSLWIFPAVLTLGAIWFFTHNRPDIAAFYAGISAVALLGLLLSFRLVLSK